jgi:hypothetical protein
MTSGFGVLEYWSKSIADLGMRNGDCRVQIGLLLCNLCFSIRNPKSQIRNHPCSTTLLLQQSFEGRKDLFWVSESQVFPPGRRLRLDSLLAIDVAEMMDGLRGEKEGITYG